MVEIFFGCSMRGGFKEVSQEELRRIQKSIKGMGHSLVTEHQTSSTFMQDESSHTCTEIHDRDYGYLLNAKIGIFEISNPSLGVGGEISDLIHLGKPVLCLFKDGLQKSISAYIRGKQGSKHVKTPFEYYAYKSTSEAENKIKRFIEENY